MGIYIFFVHLLSCQNCSKIGRMQSPTSRQLVRRRIGQLDISHREIRPKLQKMFVVFTTDCYYRHHHHLDFANGEISLVLFISCSLKKNPFATLGLQLDTNNPSKMILRVAFLPFFFFPMQACNLCSCQRNYIFFYSVLNN